MKPGEIVNSLLFDSGMNVELIQAQATDQMVTHAARVSTAGAHADQVSTENDQGLIKFLMRNRHGTPFEHGMFTFRVCVPIFVMRELHRHRIGFSYNEESGRYKELEAHFYIPRANRALIQTGKPGHYEYVAGTSEQYEDMTTALRENAWDCWTRYQKLLRDGIAKEVARMVLPVNIYSSCYITCNPRSLMSFLSLRTKSDLATYPSYPQREIEMMAEQMEQYWDHQMPMTSHAFNVNGRVSP